MIRADLIQGVGRGLSPLSLWCSQIVVRDQYGRPVFVVIEKSEGEILFFTVGDPEFDEALRYAGVISPPVTVEELKEKGFPRGRS